MQSQLFLMGIIKLLLLFICENIGSKHLKFLLLLLVSVCVLFVCMCVCFFAVCVIGLFICSCASYLNMFKFFRNPIDPINNCKILSLRSFVYNYIYFIYMITSNRLVFIIAHLLFHLWYCGLMQSKINQ